MAEQQTCPQDGGGTRLLRWSAVAFLLGAAVVCNSLNGPAPQDVSAAPGAPPAASVPSPETAGTPGTSGTSETPGTPDSTSSGGTGTWSGIELPRSQPRRLTIPRIGVNAPFTGLTLRPSGELNAPPPNDPNLVGWYRDGVTPGQRGTAVVAGHVDTTTGPAVFLLLRMLDKGDAVNVIRADGTTATFTVDSVETFRKDDFPSDRVYADTPDAQLRLITCGGVYDKSHGGYRSNVVVFARLSSYRLT